MAKVTLTEIQSGYSTQAAVNANNQRIEEGFDNTVSRDGTAPNQMTADLDMNGHYLLNQPAQAGVDAGYLYRGDWATLTTYARNNTISLTLAQDGTNGGASYICIVAHTSGTFSTDLASVYWRKTAARGANGEGTGDLIAASNLSDVDSVATSLANLGGLGDVMTTEGDITVEGASGPARLALGASGKILSSNGTTLAWIENSSLQIGATQTASSSDYLDFTANIDSTYKAYWLMLDNILPSIDGTAELVVQIYQSTLKTDAGYGYYTAIPSESGTYAAMSSGGARDTGFYIAQNVGSAASEGYTGVINLINPSNTTNWPVVNWKGTYATGSPAIKNSEGSGMYTTSVAALTGIRLVWSSGQIASGSVTLYGTT